MQIIKTLIIMKIADMLHDRFQVRYYFLESVVFLIVKEVIKDLLLNIIYIDQFKRNSTNTRYNMKADNIIKLIKSPGTPTARLLSFISFNCIVKG